MRSTALSRWMLGAASVLMIAMAGLHALGYAPLVGQLSGSRIEEAWLGGLKSLWILFSVHLLLLGAFFLAAAARPAWAAPPLVALLGLVPVCDTLVLLRFVGLFVGTISLGLAAALVYCSLLVRPATAEERNST